jgi:hypothetical protein
VRIRNRLLQGPRFVAVAGLSAPASGDWSADKSGANVRVHTAVTGPSANMLFRLYNILSPSVIIETINAPLNDVGISDTGFAGGTTVGIQSAWATSLGVRLSDWSSEKQVAF